MVHAVEVDVAGGRGHHLVVPVAPLPESADPHGTDLDARVDVHHRLTEATEAVVVGIPLDVLGAFTGPHLLPPPRRAGGAGRRHRAVDLVADLPVPDSGGLGMSVRGAKPGPVPDRLPVESVAIDADRPGIVDLPVEERHRRRRFLGGAVDRRRPHGRHVRGLEQIDEVRRAQGPRPLATLGIAHLAAQPVIAVAPAATGEAQQRGAGSGADPMELLAADHLWGEPGRDVGAEQTRRSKAPTTSSGCTTIRLPDRSRSTRSAPVDEHAASRTTETTRPATARPRLGNGRDLRLLVEPRPPSTASLGLCEVTLRTQLRGRRRRVPEGLCTRCSHPRPGNRRTGVQPEPQPLRICAEQPRDPHRPHRAHAAPT